MNKLWYIQQLDLFKGLAKEKLHSIESLFAMKEYCKREVIFEPGDRDKVFLVKTGQVELYQLAPSGNYRRDYPRVFNPRRFIDNWDCPITPKENNLPVRIEAGEKKFV